MRATLKCYSHGWNVFKRIINNRFLSSAVFFLTNMQQLKALISREGSTNGSAFRVRNSSCHISVNRMLWPELGNYNYSFFFSWSWFSMVFSLLFCKCFSPACKNTQHLHIYEHIMHFLVHVQAEIAAGDATFIPIHIEGWHCRAEPAGLQGHYHCHSVWAPWEGGRNWLMTMLGAQEGRNPHWQESSAAEVELLLYNGAIDSSGVRYCRAWQYYKNPS